MGNRAGPEGRFLLGVDDSPTQRYGRQVEGAGVHHDPTPGPAGGEWLYGHNWVALALLATHPLWRVIALPLRSLLYVREIDVPKLDEKRGWEFRTKHQLGAELVLWFVDTARSLGSKAKVWVAVDGAYAARPFLDPVRKEGVVVVSRLRKDAELFDLPPARQPRQRGRPRVYGKNKISLAKRAAHKQGWESIAYRCRGKEVTRHCKTFLATSQLVRGVIRVVIVRFDNGWAAYFCTDPTAEVLDILEAEVRVDRPQRPSLGQPGPAPLARGPPPRHWPRNAGKPISCGSAPHPRRPQIPRPRRQPPKPLYIINNAQRATNEFEPNDVDCVLLTGADYPADPIAEKELLDGLPFLAIAVVGLFDFSYLCEHMFATDRDMVPKGMIEVLL